MASGEVGLSGCVGLALGSGAARGWAHIGVIRALAEAGIRPQVVCGTSMGAIVGAAHAAGQLDAFEAWCRALEWRQMVGYFDLSFRGGLIRARRLFDFFEDVLPNRSIESLDLVFAAVGTDLSNGNEVWLRSGDLLDALRATIALPGLITPAQWRGRWLVDGGLVNPVPISLCRALGADSVIAVDLNTTLLGRRLARTDSGQGDPLEQTSTVPSPAVGTRLNALVRDIAAELRARIAGEASEERDDSPTIYEVMANSVNIMQVRIGRSRMAGDPPELLITPRMSDFSWLDFDRAGEAIEQGRRAAARALSMGESTR